MAPTDPQLDPLTLARLRQFARRRRLIITLRGLCAGVISLIGAMIVIAIPDYFFILTDTTRWALSAGAYLLAVVAVWVTCVRMMVRVPDQRELARQLESVHPDLREDLLSAVELGSTPTAHDSPTFRALLQQSVAQRLQTVRIGRLLPWRLVGWWVAACVVVVAACVTLLMTPGMEFGRLMTRALLPMANIARVSNVQVHILEPAPASLTVPQGDPVRIAIELDGPDDLDRLDLAVIETFGPDGSRQRIAMEREADRRFATTLNVGAEPVQYRILAGDAVTRRHTLDSRHRPFVQVFRKEYQYPEYSRLGVDVVTEDNGHLAALQGTQVDLLLETDQPLAAGELRLDLNGESHVVPLDVSLNRATATVPLQASGTYRVHLVAAETGFENRFSPRYEINADPDLVPHITIDQPRDDQNLPAHEIVALRGSAQDDLALATVQQQVRINRGPWQGLTLADDPGQTFQIDRLWDLQDLDLNPGDQVTTRLVAVDLAGNRAQSDPLRVTIASRAFTPDRFDTFHATWRASEAARRFVETAAEHNQAAAEAVSELLTTNFAEQDAQHYLDDLRNAIAALREEGRRAQQVITRSLAEVDRGTDAHELLLLHRGIAQAIHRDLPRAAFALHRAQQTEDIPHRRYMLTEVRNGFRDAEHRTQHVAIRYGEIMSAELARATADELRRLAQEQRRLLAAADDPQANAELNHMRLTRRLGIVADHARSLVDLHGEHHDHLYHRNRFRHLADQLLEQVEAIETARDQAADDEAGVPSTDALVSSAHAVLDRLGHIQREAIHLERDLAYHAIHKRREIFDHLAPSHAALATLGHTARGIASDHERLANPDHRPTDANQLQRQQQSHQRDLRQLLHRDWPVGIDLLRAHAEAEELRPDSNPRLVADLSLAARALAAARSAYTAEPTAELADHLRNQIIPAIRTLETGHDLAELAHTNDYLIEREQWRLRSARAHTHHPKQWDLIEPRLDRVGHRMREAGFDHEAADRLRIHHEGDFRQVREEFEQRRREPREPRRLVEPLAFVADNLHAAVELIEPRMAEARAVLSAAGPDLAQMLREAADDARDTSQLAEDLANEDADRDVDQLHQPRREMHGQLQDIRDALRQDANLQDTLTAEGRDRARDADNAAAMLEDAGRQADAAMQQALDAADDQQADALEQSAQQQEELADLLDQLGDHYESLDAGHEVADSRQALREAEQQLSLDLDPQYDQLAQLADLASLMPEQLMQQLEQQLAENRPMQQELSGISRDLVEQAQAQLADAAEQQQPLADQIAPLAQQQAEAGESLDQQLGGFRDRAAQLAESQIPDAAQAAAEAEVGPAAEPFADARARAEQATEGLPQDASLPPIELAPQLAEQAESLAAAAADLQAAAAESAIAAAQAQQQQADAAQSAAQAAQENAQQAQQASRSARDAVEQAAQADAENPDVQQAQQAAQQSSDESQQADAHAEAAQQSAQQAAEFAERALEHARAAQRQGEDVSEADRSPAARDTMRRQHLRRAQEALEQASQQSAEATEQAAESTRHAQAAHDAAAQSQSQLAEAAPDADAPAPEQADAALAESHQEAQQQVEAAENAADPEALHQLDRAQAAAHDAAAASRSLADEIDALAQSLGGPVPQLAEAAEQQVQVEQSLAEAEADLSRAARHEQRLAEDAPLGDSIAGLADDVGEVTAQTADAAEHLAQGDGPAAQPPAQAAAEALPNLADRAADLLESPSGTPAELADGADTTEAEPADAAEAPAGDSQDEAGLAELAGAEAGTPLTQPEVAQALARTLDQLDQSMNAEPASAASSSPLADAANAPASGEGEGIPTESGEAGDQPGQPGQPGPPSALSSAAEAQARAMRAQRSQGDAPGATPGQSPVAEGQSEPGEGAAVDAQPLAYDELPPATRSGDRDWGQLPPQLARDLIESQQEAIRGEYREQVETYFRVIGERARQQEDDP